MRPSSAWGPVLRRRPECRLNAWSPVDPLPASPDTDELAPLVRALFGLLEHLADPPRVHLVVDNAGLEWGPLLREQAIPYPDIGACHGVEDADDLEVVVGVALVVLLPVGASEHWVRRHEDARLGAVAAGEPASFTALHMAVPVELGG